MNGASDILVTEQLLVEEDSKGVDHSELSAGSGPQALPREPIGKMSLGIARDAIALGLILALTSCSSGGGSGSSSNQSPPQSGVDGQWQVVLTQGTVKNDPGLVALPPGSMFNIVDGELAWVTHPNTNLVWFADFASISQQMGRAPENYVNSFGDPPVMISYGYDDLGLGLDAYQETFAVIDLQGDRMFVDYYFDYQFDLWTPPVFLYTSHVLDYVGPVVGVSSTPLVGGPVASYGHSWQPEGASEVGGR